MTEQTIIDLAQIACVAICILGVTYFLSRYEKEETPRTQCFCPKCGNDLVSCEGTTWTYEGDPDEGIGFYECDVCEETSRWHFAIAPVPIMLSWKPPIEPKGPEVKNLGTTFKVKKPSEP